MTHFHNDDLDFTGATDDALRARAGQMGIQFPVWNAIMDELVRRAREREALERAADEGAYYDSFGLDVEALLRADIETSYEEERERKGGYPLRAAAARIADSQEFYNLDGDGYEDPF